MTQTVDLSVGSGVFVLIMKMLFVLVDMKVQIIPTEFDVWRK